MQVLVEPVWRARMQRHRERLAPFINAHRARRSRGHKHPVWDFLFEYYSFKPSLLERWSPGAQVLLQGDVEEFQDRREFLLSEVGALLNLEAFPQHRAQALRETIALLEATQRRTPFFGCGGMHEWAMVYQCDEVRHGQAGLRLSAGEIAAFVESQTIRCSHYDAFRFFTPNARPLNLLQPDFESRIQMEQPGCIHANMDLYKWSAKFFPWISSEIIAEAFEVALEARELDMRASPYDLTQWEFEPILIETNDGRRDYQAQQKAVAARAAPVREKLVEALEELLQVLAASRPM